MLFSLSAQVKEVSVDRDGQNSLQTLYFKCQTTRCNWGLNKPGLAHWQQAVWGGVTQTQYLQHGPSSAVSYRWSASVLPHL